MRVLIDIASLGRGGAERQVVQLATGLAERRHTCLLAVHKAVDAYAESLDANGVEVRSLGQVRKYDARVLPRLLTLYRGFRPDVVLAVEFAATLWGRLAAIVLGQPCATGEHASKERFPPAVILTNRLLGRFTRATVACASAQVPRLVAAGNPPTSIFVIHNGVDTAEFRPDRAGVSRLRESWGIPRDAVVVGLVAAHRPEKRHDRFVRLIERLGRTSANVWGCMVGGGPLLDEHRRMVRTSPIADRLVVAGPMTDMRCAYNALDLVVLLSDTETFPLSLLEAQACGRPVVGVDVGGVRETFLHGDGGVLVSAQDDDELARQVSSLLSDPEALRSMGDRGRTWVSANLSLERMIDGYEALLQAVAAGGAEDRGDRVG